MAEAELELHEGLLATPAVLRLARIMAKYFGETWRVMAVFVPGGA